MKRQPLQSVKRLFNYRLFFVVNIVILLLLALSFGREFVRSASIQREIMALEQEKSALEDRNRSLQTYEEYLFTESFLEKEAREKFGLQRPGETQVFVAEDAIAETAPVAAGEDAERVASNRQLWTWYFFDPDRYAAEQAE